MTSLSSHHDAIPTSDEPAVPRGVGPGIETPAPGGFFRRPYLLERRPTVRRALPLHEPRGVGSLEPQVHLETAVVAVAGVRAPAAFEAVDAEPRRQVRRTDGLAMRGCRPPPPERHGALDVRDAHLGQHPSLRRRPAHSHQALPAPGEALVAVHLVSEPSDRSPVLLLLLLSFAHVRPCRIGLYGAGRSRATTRDQAGAGEDESPQNTTPSVDRLQVVGRAGCVL